MLDEKLDIKNIIYEIRGKQVMLDSNLAKLYQCKNGTKTINLAVRRHINRFPERFMFQLTKKEYYNILRFQFETLEFKQGNYSKYLPYAFTEQGVAMLATIIKTEIAEEVSIKIMDAFVAMKYYLNYNLVNINNNLERINNIETIIIEHDNKIKLLQESFDKMSKNIKNNNLFFDGQIYDAYSLMLDIFNTSNKSITIIDNYIDKSLLDILAKTNKDILVITNKYSKIDFDKYKKQYHNVKIKIINKIHDRFIIIDNEILYHCGASFKDLGNKCFAISKIVDKDILDNILVSFSLTSK